MERMLSVLEENIGELIGTTQIVSRLEVLWVHITEMHVNVK